MAARWCNIRCGSCGAAAATSWWWCWAIRRAEWSPLSKASQAQVVYNADYREGRASSVRTGAQALPGNLDWIVVLGVDQPRPAGVIATMVQAARQSDASILLPVYQGRHGHPTLFSGRLLAEMAQVQDETLGLRAVVRRHESELRDVPVDNRCSVAGPQHTPGLHTSPCISMIEGCRQAKSVMQPSLLGSSEGKRF